MPREEFQWNKEEYWLKFESIVRDEAQHAFPDDPDTERAPKIADLERILPRLRAVFDTIWKNDADRIYTISGTFEEISRQLSERLNEQFDSVFLEFVKREMYIL